MAMKTSPAVSEPQESGLTLKSMLFFFLAPIAAAALAAVLLPQWAPGLAGSLTGPEPKVYWFLSRGTAIVAFVLLWLAMVSGIIITNKLAHIWPGGPLAFDLHEYLSLLGLGFATFHALVLMGDRWVGYPLWQVLIPFAGTLYRPFWVGLGQVGIYTWAVVAFTFYLRKRIGTRAWRLIHFASFAMFVLALVHGITAGTDASVPWVFGLYYVSGVTTLFLIFYRILVVTLAKKSRPAVSRN